MWNQLPQGHWLSGCAVPIQIHIPAVYSFPVTFQLVQSYVFNTSLVVSYHTIHSVGEDGAVAETMAQGNVLEISLLESMFIQVQAV